MSDAHQPVLLAEAVAALAIDADGWYIDGTYGRGGHTRAIMAKLGAQGRVLAIDKDATAVKHAQEEWQKDPRFMIVQGSFAQLKHWAIQQGMLGKISGILLDLGVSSPQLDESERGFSFMRAGPLDMRMNQQAGKTAAEYLATAEESTLVQVLKDYGEERFARRIAKSIVETRVHTPITTTTQLAELITRAVPRREPHKHPATRTFQALRIWVNNELADLEMALRESVEVLATDGRLVVISFHSLEDRIVKNFMRGEQLEQLLPREIPVQLVKKQNCLQVLGKPQKPSETEIADNPRARSAIMRVAQKVNELDLH